MEERGASSSTTPAEAVGDRNERYAVVRKRRDEPAELAEELDARR
ncbi:MAG TPA: hypothetical protein VM290_07375 [Gaiellaceae bacterium]|nr:hypothetical protein [Gaiellaceae bacterium]